MSPMQEIKQFIFNANSAFTNKRIGGKPEFKQIIKELTDPQRKTLLKIIQNPNSAVASETAGLFDAIQMTQKAIRDGTFVTRREVGLWKKICRIFSNIFQGRTRSSDVKKSIKAIEQSPLSAKNLTKIHKNLKNLYEIPQDLDDSKVYGNLFSNRMTAKIAPNLMKMHQDQIFDYRQDFVDDKVVAVKVVKHGFLSEDIRGRARNDALVSLEMDGIGNGYALLNAFGGEATKNYLEGHLLQEVHSELNNVKDNLSDTNIYNAINRAFHLCNKNWFISCERLANEAEALSSSSACVAVMIQNTLWIANVGTTRALLINDTTLEQLTPGCYLHNGLKYKPWDPATQNWGDSTTCHVKKAFGGFNIEGLSAAPDITKVADETGNVILGSNGLFDIASNQEVGDYLRACTNPFENRGAKLTNRIINGYADDPNHAPSSSIITINL